jgi:hypothetical protein
MHRHRSPFSALAALVAGLALFACTGPSQEQHAIDPDTLSRRQKDSILSTLPIPGAGAVGRALEASDTAAARGQRLDSILR